MSSDFTGNKAGVWLDRRMLAGSRRLARHTSRRGFIGKLGALLQTIPTPVMGGILVLLFGAITVVGLSSLMGAKDDLTRPRNLIIISMILVSAMMLRRRRPCVTSICSITGCLTGHVRVASATCCVANGASRYAACTSGVVSVAARPC